jgi:hypothetical protein
MPYPFDSCHLRDFEIREIVLYLQRRSIENVHAFSPIQNPILKSLPTSLSKREEKKSSPFGEGKCGKIPRFVDRTGRCRKNCRAATFFTLNDKNQK